MSRLRILFLLAIALAAVLSFRSHGQDIVFEHFVIDPQGPSDPWGKAIGDLNADGRIDLIVGGSRDGGLVWYENPNWIKHVIQPEGRWSTDHETVDVDRDGDLDIVSLTRSSLVWHEAPHWKTHLIDEQVLHDIEVADFDRDGDPDLVARDQAEFGHSGKTLHFYRQEEGDSWSHRSLACPNGEGLAAADIDRDGDSDVIINSVWFEITGDLIVGPIPQHAYAPQWQHRSTFVAVADLNRDGRDDIVLSPAELAGQRYRISWFASPENPKSDRWVEHIVDADVEAVHHFIGTADFNGDGAPDIATAEMHQGADPDEVKLYLNNGEEGVWQKQVIADSGSHSMRIFDLEGDGDPDLFGANHKGNRVELWVNQSGTDQETSRLQHDAWTYIAVDTRRDARAFGIAWGDVDGDGDWDIASGSFLYKNPGGDMASPWQRVALPAEVDANFILDVDGDEHADILAQQLPHVVWLEATDPEASQFTARNVASGLGKTTHGSSQGFALGDLRLGNKPEYLLTTGTGLYSVEIPALPTSQDWPLVHIAENAPEEGVAVADIDSDGLQDVIAWVGTGSGSNELGWWKNPGSGAKSGQWSLQRIGTVEGAEGDRIAIGDFNADGKADIAATGTTNAATGSGLYWFENTGQPSSWRRHTLQDDMGALNSLAVADFDGDLLDDIVTGEHRGQRRVSLWRNVDRGKKWMQYDIARGIESHLGVQVADLDRDGDLDMMSIGWDDFATFHLWRNDAIR